MTNFAAPKTLISRDTALTILKALDPVFHDAGYLMGLYGSLLLDRIGHDIDVLAVPWRPTTVSELDLALQGRGWTVVAKYDGLSACSRRMSQIDGVYLDIRISPWVEANLRFQPSVTGGR